MQSYSTEAWANTKLLIVLAKVDALQRTVRIGERTYELPKSSCSPTGGLCLHILQRATHLRGRERGVLKNADPR